MNSNIKLTAEQALQIIEWQNRLSVIQTEIKIAEDKIEAQNNEIQAKTKHINYLEERESILNTIVSELDAKKEIHESEIKKNQTSLAEQTEMIRNSREALIRETQEFSNKKSEIQKKHEELSQREKDVHSKHTSLSERELAVEQAKETLLKAIDSITWK